MVLIFDFSFIDSFIKNQNDSNFISHKSMDVIYHHYKNFNINKNFLSKTELLERNINSFSGKSIQDLITTRDYVKNNSEKWKNILTEQLKTKIPTSYVIKSTIYFSIGYDMGIAFDDDVVIDLSFSYFQQYPEEILYFILRELSHVVIYTYHKPLNFSLAKNCKDLSDIVRFHTLLEGLGVYFPYELRKKDKNLFQSDYQNLLEKKYLDLGEKKINEIISQLANNSQKILEEKDWHLLDDLSEKRYWYVIGAKMALDIEKNYGRERVIQCIIEGEDLFFKLYNQIKKKL